MELIRDISTILETTIVHLRILDQIASIREIRREESVQFNIGIVTKDRFSRTEDLLTNSKGTRVVLS